MKKQLLIVLLVLALSVNPTFCHAGTGKLLLGLGLIGGGLFLAIDGFSKGGDQWREKNEWRVPEQVAGLVIIGAGTYLVTNYFTDLKKEANINVGIVRKNNATYLFYSKKF